MNKLVGFVLLVAVQWDNAYAGRIVANFRSFYLVSHIPMSVCVCVIFEVEFPVIGLT